ncbi:MAG: hypothetical protein WA970_17800 [Gammaproteobacteria bacterium]
MKKHANARLQRQQQKRARHTARRQEKKRLTAPTQSRGKAMVGELFKTINHFFPDLFDQLRQIEDCRRRSDYTLSEILMAAIALFIFQQGSRNAFNNLRQEAKFKKHYRRLFKLRLPHLDTVHRVLCRLTDAPLEQLKQWLVKTLLEKKALHKYRLFGQYFVVAVDATGIMSFAEKHCEQCLHRTSKTGKTTYFHNVLEAKLITANGFAISLATEWIANPLTEYDKQDGERNAFVRLAAKLKQLYPRLPICLTADGLYPYQRFLDICRTNHWAFILTFQDGNLPSVWEEVWALLPLRPDQHRHERRFQSQERIEQDFRWVSDLDYRGHRLQWLECLETVTHLKSGEQTTTRFVHLTNLAVTATTVVLLSATGRLRWKIENEGFNTQKHLGYALQHKYARVNWQAAKNYYQCLQIGHLINQLMVLSTTFVPLRQGTTSLRHLWRTMIAFLLYGRLRRSTLDALAQRHFQVRFT